MKKTSANKTKTCIICGRTLPIEAFGKNKMTFDGHLKMCKECHKARLSRYKETSGDNKLEFECEHCHKKFYLYKTQYEKLYKSKGLEPRFCSKECKDEYSKTLTHKTCTCCGKTLPIEDFPVQNRNKNLPRLNICKKCASERSRESHSKMRFVKRRGAIEYTCLNCGRKFYLTPNQTKDYTPKYCCRECKTEYGRRKHDSA